MFCKIETFGRVRGTLIQSSYSYPEGASYEEYRRKDEALVKAFGPNSKTIGTFADDAESQYRNGNISPLRSFR